MLLLVPAPDKDHRRRHAVSTPALLATGWPKVAAPFPWRIGINPSFLGLFLVLFSVMINKKFSGLPASEMHTIFIFAKHPVDQRLY
jgi:hypothetical protein